jgi:1,2-diacylglycerol 3-beta-galactosyltransferase
MKADLIFFDAGAGHRAAAQALFESMRGKWEVSLIDFRDVIDDVDLIKRFTTVTIEDFYNWYLRQGYTVGSGVMLRVFQAMVRGFHGRLTKAVTKYWESRSPDIIVSLVPNINLPLFSGTKALNKPYVTIMTDMEDQAPHFWMEQQDQYIIVGTDLSYMQARGYYERDHIFQVSGLVVHPTFYTETSVYPAEAPCALICFGGSGSARMIPPALTLDSMGITPIIICGHNDELLQQIKAMTFKTPRVLVGFVSNLPHFMNASQFMVGKPGPGMIAQALVKGLPVLLDNVNVMVQERYNLTWVQQNGVGWGGDICDSKVIIDFVRNLDSYRSKVAALPPNRAVMEIPDILESIVNGRHQKNPDQS